MFAALIPHRSLLSTHEPIKPKLADYPPIISHLKNKPTQKYKINTLNTRDFFGAKFGTLLNLKSKRLILWLLLPDFKGIFMESQPLLQSIVRIEKDV
jgi:hypothetical protein